MVFSETPDMSIVQEEGSVQQVIYYIVMIVTYYHTTHTHTHLSSLTIILILLLPLFLHASVYLFPLPSHHLSSPPPYAHTHFSLLIQFQKLLQILINLHLSLRIDNH